MKTGHNWGTNKSRHLVGVRFHLQTQKMILLAFIYLASYYAIMNQTMANLSCHNVILLSTHVDQTFPWDSLYQTRQVPKIVQAYHKCYKILSRVLDIIITET